MDLKFFDDKHDCNIVELIIQEMPNLLSKPRVNSRKRTVAEGRRLKTGIEGKCASQPNSNNSSQVAGGVGCGRYEKGHTLREAAISLACSSKMVKSLITGKVSDSN